MSRNLRYSELDIEGEDAKRFANLVFNHLKDGYPEYTDYDGNAYDYGNVYEIGLKTKDGEWRKIRIKQRGKSPALASVLFLDTFHNSQVVIDEIQVPMPEKRKPGRPRKVDAGTDQH